MEKANTNSGNPAPVTTVKRRSSVQGKLPVKPTVSAGNNNNLAAVAAALAASPAATPRRSKSRTKNRRASPAESKKTSDVGVGSGQTQLSSDTTSNSPSPPPATQTTARRSRSRVRRESSAGGTPRERSQDNVLQDPVRIPRSKSSVTTTPASAVVNPKVATTPSAVKTSAISADALQSLLEHSVLAQAFPSDAPEPLITPVAPKSAPSKQIVFKQPSKAQIGTLAMVMANSPVVPKTSSKRVALEPKPNFTLHRSMVSFNSRNGMTTVSPTYRAFVEKAIKDRKVFSLGGAYPAIRNALKKRGWIEKALNTSVSTCMKTIIQSGLTREVDTKPQEDETEQAYCQRILTNYPSDFIWVIRRDNIAWNQLDKHQMINRFPKAYFTTKVGIAACLQAMQWYNEAGVADTLFPRCYRLCQEEEKVAFVDDYRMTACIALLRWIVLQYEKDGERGVFDHNSRISCLCVDFAVRQINNYVRMRRHEDIDWVMPPAFMLQHWDVFINQYYAIVHQRMKLSWKDSAEGARSKYDLAKKTLSRLGPYWPQLHVDGTMNIWICKPGARSRGKGITIMNKIENIMDLQNQSNFRESNWVVQKYIERPLLIYKTKFDMRQWFVITDWAPLTIWFAKESYVRFCTKPFTLEEFHESIHLCNNAIQCKYQNAHERDSALPDENMWDCYTFQAYLKTIGKLDYWDKIIYPGMKQSIIGVMLASQEGVDPKKNCFELYGADFMLTEDYRPWLIEINSCPCMSASTSVTARMCAQCLEDTIKVVIDRKADRNCDTGMFELIFRQNPDSLGANHFGGIDLQLQGKKLSKDVDWPGIMSKYNSKRGSQSFGTNNNTHARNSQALTSISNGNAVTFMDLVHKLKLDTLPPSIKLDTPNLTPYSQQLITESPPSRRRHPPPGSEEAMKPGANNILSVRKMIPGIPDPAFAYNGVNYNIRSSETTQPGPLYSQISSKAQTQMYNGSSGNALFGTVGKTHKDTPLTALLKQPVGLTMADLLRDQEDRTLEAAMEFLTTSNKNRKSKSNKASAALSRKRSSVRTHRSNRSPVHTPLNGSRSSRPGVVDSSSVAAAVSVYNPAVVPPHVHAARAKNTLKEAVQATRQMVMNQNINLKYDAISKL